MLKFLRHRASNADGPFLPYRCTAAAYPLHEVRTIPLGSHDAASPRLALRWLQERTRHITDQLDAPHAQPGLYWLTDDTEHERALAYMTAGTGYQLTLHDESARYVLAVHPTGAMP
ncbi:hypothetical protein LUX12_12020 [Streptomyces somaliensis]|uniref:hypothetical protein n=1 Tax=Streptomyces somaliensis TaxID=78355 RepID=UPI0020CE88B9|nr:hypothetical protein [Streptomyces somaliensis]MCP9945348.1 hypothetical protein [Streptomyces somaliensis]MCP9961447.1 hypothetical protein [Streptomyces somaliensis]MCP9974256.1 hypothetical protein [Streptomyces somaliensis]